MTTTLTTSRGTDFVTDGHFVAVDGIIGLLTTCCQASAKGAERGVVCRACHRLIDERFGMAWMASDFIAQYPQWCKDAGLTEGTPDVLTHYAALILRELS